MEDKKKSKKSANSQKSNDSGRDIRFNDSGRDIIRMEAPEPWPEPPKRREEKKNSD